MLKLFLRNLSRQIDLVYVMCVKLFIQSNFFIYFLSYLKIGLSLFKCVLYCVGFCFFKITVKKQIHLSIENHRLYVSSTSVTDNFMYTIVTGLVYNMNVNISWLNVEKLTNLRKSAAKKTPSNKPVVSSFSATLLHTGPSP